jgi:hypothetical protein
MRWNHEERVQVNQFDYRGEKSKLGCVVVQIESEIATAQFAFPQPVREACLETLREILHLCDARSETAA